MTYFKFIILTFIGFCSINQLSGQKGYELGGWLGFSNYFGDLNTQLNISQVGLAGGLNARYNFNTRTSVKSSLSYARLRANDDFSSVGFERQRNLNFFSNTFDFTATGEFNFFEYVHGSKFDFWTPYLAAGFSAFRFNPKSKLNDVTYTLRDFGTEGQEVGEEYLRFGAGLTIGGGVKWDINRDLSINVEFTVRRLFTDYIDDVSTVYPDPAILAALRAPNGDIAQRLSRRALNPDILRTGTQRGNSRDNDTYTLLGISLMKYFGRIECPKLSQRSL
jgi:Domain of unknown function (DUF6089)